MATKWIDYFPFTTWNTLEQETILMYPILKMCMEASRERLAFVENLHEAEFDDLAANKDKTFPYLLEDRLLRWELNWNTTGKRLEDVLERSLFFTKTGFTWRERKDFVTGYIPDIYIGARVVASLGSLLTTYLGYASTVPLHRVSTGANLGKQIPLSTYPKQWFEALNYPQYLQVGTTYASTTPTQRCLVTATVYGLTNEYPIGTINAENSYFIVSVNGVEVLNENYPTTNEFSTVADAKTEIETYLTANLAGILADNTKWTNNADSRQQEVLTVKQTRLNWTIDDTKQSLIEVTFQRFFGRYKVDERKRPLSPNTFTPKVYQNRFFYDNIKEQNTYQRDNVSGSDADIDTLGAEHRIAYVEQLTADANDWYLPHEHQGTPPTSYVVYPSEFTEAQFLALKGGSDRYLHSKTERHDVQQYFLVGSNPAGAVIGGSVTQSVRQPVPLLLMDDPDGTAFEYYTP